MLATAYWDQAAALVGQGRDNPGFAFRLRRRDPLPPASRAALLATIGVFGVLPYAGELLRCWRARPTVKPLEEPAEPPTETLQR